MSYTSFIEIRNFDLGTGIEVGKRFLVFMWPRASARTFCADSGAIPPHQGLFRNQP